MVKELSSWSILPAGTPSVECLRAMNVSGEVPYRFLPPNNLSSPEYNPAAVLPDQQQQPSKLQSAPVIALFVLAALVAVIGILYAYLYVTKINPRPSRNRQYMDTGADDEATGQGTHLFLFRRS
ncbi:hypothetical protein CAPTEDRAFT_217943 [Capitella teleta]|uniref:Uncharacterized protein n=1 Tax=Capitella teleta TaxID=283909 RepID=R7UQF6_CAPTE|nr:hypothetical protein CAPTEDRAFT_217943 [Capitella teleta]|eukprot:ELU08425.1 hypothetical protein CAPTEDRAFT_217943 [Capitella teleta]